jgi:hypothetical protein
MTALEHSDYCDCGRQYVGGIANTADSECPALTCDACPRAGCICPPCECLACRQRHRKAMKSRTRLRRREDTPVRQRLFDPEPLAGVLRR